MSAGRLVLEVLGLSALVWAAAAVGLLIQFDNLLSPFWPPTAVLLAVILVSPRNRWPWYVLALLPVKTYLALGAGLPPWAAVLLLASTCAQVAVPAYLIRRYTERPAELSSVSDVVRFVLLVAVLAPLIKTLMMVPVLWRATSDAGALWPLGRDAFLSELVAFLIIAPLILTAFGGDWRGRWRQVARARLLLAEAAIVWVSVLATSLFAFVQVDGAHDHLPLALYLPIPFLLWAAVRLGTIGVSVGLLTLTAVAIVHGARHEGPFGQGLAHNVLSLQLFLIALALPLLLLSAVVREREAAAAAARASEERYGSVLETQTELVCRYLPDGTLTFVNGAYCRYFGRPREELVGQNFLDLLPPHGRAAAMELIARVIDGTAPVTWEHEVTAADGKVGWQHWVDSPVSDAEGRVVELQGIGRDVTERRRAEVALQASLAEVKALRDRLQAENTYLHEELASVLDEDQVVARSEAMRTVLEHVHRVAPTSTTVLVLGETGTGKEVVARALHRHSGRRDRPLVRVNCASLPSNLIESELFGHERGAFTGASARRVGRFEVADGATLFLDEIGELPLELQAKLLRVLQEGEFERLGSSKTLKTDVRVIAATNRDLSEAVHAGAFRADLYYRLNVFPIFVPPLRSRREDIVPLAIHFLEAAGRRLGRACGPLNRATADALTKYDWPGNVRELENVIERAAVVSPPTSFHLPERWDHASRPVEPAPSGGGGLEPTTPLASLADVEANHIRAVLNHTSWRVEGPRGAAAILGLSPSTLRFRIKKLNITR